MRASSKFLALALTAALQPAIAGVVPLTFEDITLADTSDGYVELKNRYIKDGVVFSGAAWGVVAATFTDTNTGQESKCGGEAQFAPLGGGCNALSLTGGSRFMLNFAQGFTSGSSLYYSALPQANDVTITVYTGENETGDKTVFAGLTQASCSTIPGVRFCNWDLLNLTFDGTARSLVVSGTDQSLLLDNFSLIQAVPTGPGRLPEPGSIALAFSALGALGWARKRAAR